MSKDVDINIGGEWCGLLFVALVVLKLCNVIDWSWWWVTAPIWLPICVVLGFLLIIAIVGGIAILIAHCGEKRGVNKR